MDSFRGSVPLNFISFRLENQTTEDAKIPANTSAIAPLTDSPTNVEPQIQDPITTEETTHHRVEDVTSTHSADSDPDVTAYAESMVRQLESAQTPSQSQEDVTHTEPTVDESPRVPGDSPTPIAAEDRRSSTPLASDEEETPNVDLSALESAFQVVMTSGSQLPELVDPAHSGNNTNGDSPAQHDSEAVYSVCDAPSLPGGECKVRYSAYQSEDDGGTEQSSLLVPVASYGRHPFSHGSETEGGDETGSELLVPGASKQPLRSSRPKENPHNFPGEAALS